MARHRRPPWPLGPARAGARALIGLALALAAAGVAARDPDAAAKALIARYVAGWDVQGLLAEPDVRRELAAVAGSQLRAIEAALGVTGGVEYVGGALAVAGNAPHQGGQTEAIVCIEPWGTPLRVHAALLSRGHVTVYTRQPRWDFLTICIRDWAALAVAGRQARIEAPPGVRLMPAR